MKRISLSLIVFILICSLVGCTSDIPDDQNSSNIQQQEQKHLTLAYCFNDVINPYNAVTEVNQKLSSLLFDSLVTFDESYSVRNLLAESIVLEGKVCKIVLKDTTFSDASKLTASDIIYSAERAKESGKYSTLFSLVESITADNEKTVIFTLKDSDPYFSTLLTFPIIKYGTADLKTENNLSLPPIGCGKYIPNFDELKLLRNENYHGAKPSDPIINLVNIPDYDALSYAVSSGKISLWYDTYKGADTLVASGGTVAVASNNLIYIGLNSENKILSLPQMRYALSAILDRSVISSEVYDNYAKSSSGIYNPSWNMIAGIQENTDRQNNNIFVANLEEIGYNRLDSSGFRLTNDGKSFEFKLVYCNDTLLKSQLAEEICNQFNKSGIKIDLEGLAYSDYMVALNSKKFDLYLAETVIPDNMDISSLVCDGGKLNYGGTFGSIISDEQSEDTLIYTTFDQVITAHRSGAAELYDIVNMFSLQMPIIPICYKSNTVSYQSGVSSSWNCSPRDPYYTITDCVIK